MQKKTNGGGMLVNDKKIEDVIEQFIKRFDGSQKVFLHGCCYWFAWILKERFYDMLRKNKYGCDIVYEPVEGHFLFAIYRADEAEYQEYSYFDIRGNVTSMYNGNELYKRWHMKYSMPKYYANLMRDCRDIIADVDED